MTTPEPVRKVAEPREAPEATEAAEATEVPDVWVLRHRDRDDLAHASASRLLAAIGAALEARGAAHVVLTGGSMGSAILATAGELDSCADLAWGQVHLWWGDERFLPAGDPDRNDTQNREALLDRLPLDPANVHTVPGPGTPHGADPATAAAAYAGELAAAAYAPSTDGATCGPADDDVAAPLFDVVLLGVGDDGHVASLFPGHPALTATGTTAAVLDSPKPPPARVTLTFAALRHTRAVWFLVSGADKATAVARGVLGDAVTRTPAAHVQGREETFWLVDAAAAADLPRPSPQSTRPGRAGS